VHSIFSKTAQAAQLPKCNNNVLNAAYIWEYLAFRSLYRDPGEWLTLPAPEFAPANRGEVQDRPFGVNVLPTF